MPAIDERIRTDTAPIGRPCTLPRLIVAAARAGATGDGAGACQQLRREVRCMSRAERRDAARAIITHARRVRRRAMRDLKGDIAGILRARAYEHVERYFQPQPRQQPEQS